MQVKGSVKKEGKSWYYVFSLPNANGERKQKKKRGFKTKKEAQMALAEAINAVNKGSYIEPSTVLYKDYLEQWFKTKQNSIGVQTARVYKDHLNGKIIPCLGKVMLSKLTAIQIQTFINGLSQAGLRSSTVKKTFEIIRNSLEHAVDFEMIPKNPAKKVKLPKSNKKEMNIWNENEVNCFLEVAKKDPIYIVFILALTTGMRQGEILGVRWKDVDLEKGLINIQQTLSHDGKTFLSGAKTKSSLRTINLSLATINHLKRRKRIVSKEKLSLGPEYQDFDLIACTQHGTPLNPANVRRSFNRLINLADVPKIRFHDLRHTHATLLLSKGVNVKVISERLGHSDIKVTLETYSHVLPTMQEEAVKHLDEIIR
nr:site-specific integrase [Bacillus sp. ISL-47]